MPDQEIPRLSQSLGDLGIAVGRRPDRAAGACVGGQHFEHSFNERSSSQPALRVGTCKHRAGQLVEGHGKNRASIAGNRRIDHRCGCPTPRVTGAESTSESGDVSKVCGYLS